MKDSAGNDCPDEYEVVVAGGGLAGICAAIGAARCGVRTALIHDRPLLGGNASGELRVHIAGADCSGTSIARFVRESGIIDELRLENLYRNPAASHDVFSLILREYVMAETNIDLYMNTHVSSVKMTGDGEICSVTAFQLGTEKQFDFKASIFIDCTGDGVIAAKSGANFRIGREAKAEFNESLAPDTSDEKTLPSCVEFYLKDMGKPTEFKPPAYAYKYENDNDLPFRSTDRSQWEFADLHGGFWWLSTGGDKSTINDNEAIYQELLKVVMGLWDRIKNHGDGQAENFALDWISPITGKRESRRIEGDYWLNQNDVLEGKIFDDRVAYGGWPIDIHPPEGIFSKEPPNLHVPLSRPYTIGLRSFYSKNISNLMFAGRDASFTHVGLGSPRVMATCAVAGHAVGVAAAIAVQENKRPRQVQQEDVKKVQQQLLKQGAYIPGCLIDDSENLARDAKVCASSEAVLCVEDGSQDGFCFGHRLFQLFPVSADRVDSFDILVEVDEGSNFSAGIRRADDIWDFSYDEDIAIAETMSKEGGRQWVSLKFNLKDVKRGLYWIWVDCDNGGAKWLGRKESAIGLVRGRFEPPECQCPELAPSYQTMGGTFVFRLSPESRPYSAENLLNGVCRSEGWTNAWVSQAIGKSGQWVELGWDKAVEISCVRIDFDGQFDSNVTWPEPLGVFGCKVLPAIVKKYDIQAKIDGSWKVLVEIDTNYQYHRVHCFEKISVDAVRINVYETNGVSEARIFEVDVYCN